MKDHIIICGYGRNGRQAAIELKNHNQPHVIIENKHEIVAAAIERKENPCLMIEGDATQDEVLIKAGINNARALITVLPNDADNLYVVLSARSLNPRMTIISRASEDISVKKLKIAGADNIIMPDKIGGAQMALLVMKPNIIEFLDNIFVQDNESSNLVEIACSDLPDNFKNNTIKELDIRSISGANIIGFKTSDGKYVINPSPDTQLIADSRLFVLGTPEQIDKLKSIFKSSVA